MGAVFAIPDGGTFHALVAVTRAVDALKRAPKPAWSVVVVLDDPERSHVMAAMAPARIGHARFVLDGVPILFPSAPDHVVGLRVGVVVVPTGLLHRELTMEAIARSRVSPVHMTSRATWGPENGR